MKTRSQRSLLLAFIISIASCGVIGIYCLLIGNMGNLEARILLTSTTVGGGSILGLVGAIPWERRRWHPLGPVSVLGTSVGVIFCLYAIWLDPRYDSEFWKLMGTSCVVGVALPHIALLSLARLRRQYGWIRRMTIVAIIPFASGIIFMIVVEDSWLYGDTMWRAIGIFSIATACGTIAVPIMHRVSAIRVREDIKTTDLILSLTCPRCEKTQQLPAGRSRCEQCKLQFRIEIEEEQCVTCGYPLYRLTSAACPECGTPISQSAAKQNT